MNIDQLNEKFAIANELRFENGKGDLPFVKIKNDKASCTLSLYGAHVLSFIPNQQEEVLWLSKTSEFKINTPIRGGIPICFPWFGPHANDGQKPPHGFARLVLWDVEGTKQLPNGDTHIALGLSESDYTKNIWPHAFKAQINVTVGKELVVELTYTNTSTETFTCTDALHTYFNIGDLNLISIDGLSEATYYDGFATELLTQNTPTLKIEKEENRRYVNHTNECTIVDEVLNRKIKVSKTGSNVTVVWNPHLETSKKIGDIHEGGYKNFICVEAVNAYQDSIVLSPGESWSISTNICIV